MQSAKLFLGLIFSFYVLTIFLTMIKTKSFFKICFLNALQGICSLFAVNLLGQYLSIHLPTNGWTIGLASTGGISGVIMILLCDSFL